MARTGPGLGVTGYQGCSLAPVDAGRIARLDEGIRAFSETDFTADLKKIDVPTLIIHGDDDQNVPIAGSALLSSKLIRKAALKVYPERRTG